MKSYTHLLMTSAWEDTIHPFIVIIEDSDEDFYTFLRVVDSLDVQDRSHYKFLRFIDGDEALDYLYRQGQYQELKALLPVAILLDLNLPGTDGRDIIKSLKHSHHLKMLPIVVFTSSNSSRDIRTCYQYGANSYMLKPMGILEMQKTVKVLFQHWFKFSILPSYGTFPS